MEVEIVKKKESLKLTKDNCEHNKRKIEETHM